MRTTLDLDDDLLTAARRQAAANGTTLTAFVEHALAASLTRPAVAESQYQFRWKTHRGRTLPGVDVADRDRLYERMDGRSRLLSTRTSWYLPIAKNRLFMPVRLRPCDC